MEWLLLLLAGILGGVVNSIAGGGSFITFPALLAAGVPPVSANATNTFSACAGYLSGAVAFREELAQCRPQLPRIIFLSLAGGLLGAWLLLQTSDDGFRQLIPWLMLFATLLFVFGERLNHWVARVSAGQKNANWLVSGLLSALFLGVAIYGGFFNAGLGIVILSYLALAGYRDINVMNALKLLVSSVISLIAIVLFIAQGAIAWFEGTLVLVGTLIGGYAAARVSRQIPQALIRTGIIIASIAITGYFFWDVYGQH